MRKCGVLCPIFSLPSPYGIGTMGKSAYVFVDLLKKQDRVIGRFYRSVRQDMEILLTSHFRPLREIPILSIWIFYGKKDFLP